MDAVTWTALGVGVTILGTVIGVVSRLLDRISIVKVAVKEAQDSADAANVTAAAANVRIAQVERDFAAHQVMVAEKYVSVDSLRDVQKNILDAIKELTTRLNQLFTPHT